MGSEMDQHLGYVKHYPAGRNSGNSRNGRSKKTILADYGELQIEVPRDRNNEFEPQIVKKHQRRFEGFDDKIISMYGRGKVFVNNQWGSGNAQSGWWQTICDGGYVNYSWWWGGWW